MLPSSASRLAREHERQLRRDTRRVYRQYWWRRNRSNLLNLLVAALATGVLLLALMAEWRWL